MPEHQVLPSELEPVDNHILFQFVDDLDKARRNTFKEKTDWGFELRGDLESTTQDGRWAYIIGLGPEAMNEDFHIGQKILIDNLMWTKVCEYGGVEFARTDTNYILAVVDDE